MTDLKKLAAKEEKGNGKFTSLNEFNGLRKLNPDCWLCFRLPRKSSHTNLPGCLCRVVLTKMVYYGASPFSYTQYSGCSHELILLCFECKFWIFHFTKRMMLTLYAFKAYFCSSIGLFVQHVRVDLSLFSCKLRPGSVCWSLMVVQISQYVQWCLLLFLGGPCSCLHKDLQHTYLHTTLLYYKVRGIDFMRHIWYRYIKFNLNKHS